ncbi:uncharacterized protein [Ptychodera flava]|uniref:uncharacterized protein isoform X1 n=2 Tax=Ptychodera flava TaxID=63121 RepID=UPI00396A2B36
MEANDSASEDEEVLLLLLLLRRCRRRRRAACRTTWTRQWIMRRQAQGVYANLVQELRAEDPESFRQFHRLDRQSFQDILTMISPYIEKQDTNMRSAVNPSERLAVTLRFLATGETFRSLSFQFRIGERSVSAIIEETCGALYNAMKEKFLKTPTSKEEWLKIAEEFHQKWNYPCCIGAIDGKITVELKFLITNTFLVLFYWL